MIVAALSIAAAQLVFDNARIASAEDAGRLWGKPLYGPMMIVDRNTRAFVRNDGTNGTLPAGAIVANTATAIDGKLTTMIALQSLGETAVQQRRLAMHECWHRIQNEIGFPASNPNNAHLDTVDGRVSLQLELPGFAYLTGPAYGLLLDELKPGWTRSYKASDDLAAVLGGQARVPVLHGERYGETGLRASEELRDREQRERVARYRARLVDGPVLELPMIDAHFGFDPNAVVPLGEAGNAYPTLDVTAPWGHISVDSGARIPNDWSKIFVAADDRAKLELKPGCKVVAGLRKGDYRVTCE